MTSYFVRKLPAAAQRCLSEVKETLPLLRVGTVCAGTDGVMAAVRAAADHCGVVVEHTFTCEISEWKREFAHNNTAPPERPKHRFSDCQQFIQGELTDVDTGLTLAGKDLQIDILIVGFSCKTLSGEYECRSNPTNQACLRTVGGDDEASKLAS